MFEYWWEKSDFSIDSCSILLFVIIRLRMKFWWDLSCYAECCAVKGPFTRGLLILTSVYLKVLKLVSHMSWLLFSIPPTLPVPPPSYHRILIYSLYWIEGKTWVFRSLVCSKLLGCGKCACLLLRFRWFKRWSSSNVYLDDITCF